MSADASDAQLLRRGSLLLKINSGGAPKKKHVYLSDDLRYLQWEPSVKGTAADFVDLDTLACIRPGRQGLRLDALRANAGTCATLMAQRASQGEDDFCGWLDVLTSAKGAPKKIWTRRWCVVRGTAFLLFTSPADAEPRDAYSLAGAVIGTDPSDALVIFMRWPDPQQGEEDRELRAATLDLRDACIAVIRRTLRFDRFRAGTRPGNTALMPGTRGGGEGEGGGGGGGGRSADEEARAKAMRLAQLAPPPSRGGDGGADDGPPPVDAWTTGLYLQTKAEAAAARDPKAPAAPKRGAALVTGSLCELERWYFGLTRALSQRRRLGLDQQAALHRAALMSPSSASSPASPRGGAAASGSSAASQDAVARVALALVLERQGDSDGALRYLREAVGAQPLLPSARKHLGRLLLDVSRDVSSAMPHLIAAASQYDRQDSATMMMLGRAHDEARSIAGLGSPALACVAYETVLVLDPRAAHAHARLGGLLLDVGKSEDAVTHLRAAVRALPTSPDLQPLLIYSDLSAALVECGRRGDALEEMRTCLASARAMGVEEESPEYLAARAQLGRVLVSLGKHSAAISHLHAAHVADAGSSDKALALAGAFLGAEAAREGGSATGGKGAARGGGGGERKGASSKKGGDQEGVSGGGRGDEDEADGVAHVDALLPEQLLGAAEALIIAVLTRDAAHAGASMMMGRICERHATIQRAWSDAAISVATAEAEAAATAASAAAAVAAAADGDEAATAAAAAASALAADAAGAVEALRRQDGGAARLAGALDAYARALALASAQEPRGEEIVGGASFALGRLAHARADYEAAAGFLKTSVANDSGSSRKARDLYSRVKRLLAGKPEFGVDAPTPAGTGSSSSASAAAAVAAAAVTPLRSASGGASLASSAGAGASERTSSVRARGGAQSSAAAASRGGEDEEEGEDGEGEDDGDFAGGASSGGGGGGGGGGGDDDDSSLFTPTRGKKSGDDAFAYTDLGVSVAGMSGSESLPPEERKRLFFATMRETKKREAEEAARTAAAKLAAMTVEERAAHEAEEAARIKREAKKERVLTSQLGAYGATPTRGRGGARGRGRGRGGGTPRA